jgi:c-di-GMP-binding flagellar brake protein YcgR
MKNSNAPADRPNPPPSATQLTLEALKPHIGDPVRLMAQDNTHHIATLVGYLKGQGLIVTLPVEPEGAMQPRVGQTLVARIFIDNRPCEFDTIVRHVSYEPFLQLYLDCPEVLRASQARQHERIRINITGYADAPDGKSFSCAVRDISLGGAMISVGDQAGAVNDSLTLTLNVVLNGVEYSLSLEGEIRSIRLSEASNEGKPVVLQGLAFKNLSQQDVMALAAFDLLPDWDNP